MSILSYIMQAKYEYGSLIMPWVSNHWGSSKLWKQLVKTWPTSMKRFLWHIGNRTDAWFWKDDFLAGVGPLESLVSEPIPKWIVNFPVASFLENVVKKERSEPDRNFEYSHVRYSAASVNLSDTKHLQETKTAKSKENSKH
ncbi:hypothetical protein RJT34_24731 [Clitoria ternatea]|uniref:Reverse transcriptase zinc-binding domain-containing protein n=1 Tax=Clitoria ternatea TaxID=43366 RepID=A0AAN9FUP0_CLITE